MVLKGHTLDKQYFRDISGVEKEQFLGVMLVSKQVKYLHKELYISSVLGEVRNCTDVVFYFGGFLVTLSINEVWNSCDLC